RGLSQAEVALRIGTTQSAVARLESARSDTRLSTVQRYAEAVGARLVVLSGGDTSLARTADDVRTSIVRHDADEALRHIVQFLNDLREIDSDMRHQAVREEPEPVGDPRWDALLGGIAEYASQLFGFRLPGWATAPSRFLQRFWFVIEDILGWPAPGLAVLAFVATPPALANRGVFLDRASLVSV
ncbi:MAG: helix-turn-helix domain-containing protein, partial [Pseudonocardiaceae bacterium]